MKFETPARTRFVVFPHQEGLRLDQFLAASCETSRRQLRELAAAGQVSCDGRPLRVLSRRVHTGQVFEVRKPATELGAPTRPQTPPFEIVFEDGWLLVGDKPAGVLSQPIRQRPSPAPTQATTQATTQTSSAHAGPASAEPAELAFDERATLHLAVRDGRAPFLRLVHRLDRWTSGLALFARRPAALAPLTRAWQRGTVHRRYLAVVEGVADWSEQLVDRPVARVPGGAWRFETADRGKPARTSFRVLGRGEEFTVVEGILETGRTHQVRVHLASLGLPVLGDRLYGGASSHEGQPVRRPLLHAASLSLPHPRSEEPLELTSRPPEDMRSFLETISPGPAPTTPQRGHER